MADEPKKITPQAVSDIRERFRVQTIDNIKKSAENLFKSFTEQEAPKQPLMDKGGEEGWDGDLFNLEDIAKVFARNELEEDFNTVIDPDQADKGVIGDLMTISTQGDWLATNERSFRSRHSTPVRAWVHAAGRRRGHAHDGGIIQRGLLDFVERLLKESKNSEPNE